MKKQNEQRQQMFSMIEAWKTSGQSQKAYCREQDTPYHVFHYWYKRYRKEQSEIDFAPSPFLALQIPSATTTAIPFAELVLPDGKRLVLHHPTDAQTLLTLLQ